MPGVEEPSDCAPSPGELDKLPERNMKRHTPPPGEHDELPERSPDRPWQCQCLRADEHDELQESSPERPWKRQCRRADDWHTFMQSGPPSSLGLNTALACVLSSALPQPKTPETGSDDDRSGAVESCTDVPSDANDGGVITVSDSEPDEPGCEVLEVDTGDGTDSDSESVEDITPGSGESSGEEPQRNSSEEEDRRHVRRLSPFPEKLMCRNCTDMSYSRICMRCGHSRDRDEMLLSPVPPRPLPNAFPTALVFDPEMEGHEGDASHPERPDRLRAIMARLLSSGVAGQCSRVPSREATLEEIHAVHTPSHARAVRIACERARTLGSYHRFTRDTYACPVTYRCALLAAGSCVEAVKSVVTGQVRSAAAIVRPPGHHAESNTIQGFCVFNNAAVAARAAQKLGAEKVMILDWDVHHGNGTQEIFLEDPSVLYVSVHRYEGGHFYPGTMGDPRNTGRYNGTGYNVNIGWPEGPAGNTEYLAAFHTVVLPIAYEFKPDLVIVSAGFDAAKGDLIGKCQVTPECFGHMTHMLMGVGPTALLLEGGYNLTATADCTEACLRVMMGESPPRLPAHAGPYPPAMRAIHEAARIQADHWNCMRARLPPADSSPSVSPASGSPGIQAEREPSPELFRQPPPPRRVHGNENLFPLSDGPDYFDIDPQLGEDGELLTPRAHASRGAEASVVDGGYETVWPGSRAACMSPATGQLQTFGSRHSGESNGCGSFGSPPRYDRPFSRGANGKYANKKDEQAKSFRGQKCMLGARRTNPMARKPSSSAFSRMCDAYPLSPRPSLGLSTVPRESHAFSQGDAVAPLNTSNGLHSPMNASRVVIRISRQEVDEIRRTLKAEARLRLAQNGSAELNAPLNTPSAEPLPPHDCAALPGPLNPSSALHLPGNESADLQDALNPSTSLGIPHIDSVDLHDPLNTPSTGFLPPYSSAGFHGLANGSIDLDLAPPESLDDLFGCLPQGFASGLDQLSS